MRSPFERLRRRRDDAERTRRRFARRQWARRWLTLRVVLIVLALVLVVGGGIYAVYFSHTFAVQKVEVSGNSEVPTELALRRADVPTDGPLATVDLGAIERRVESLAPVKSVEVSRKWPHTVLIEITERVPVALVHQGTSWRAVDDQGVLFLRYQRVPRRLALPLIETDSTEPDDLREGAVVAAALSPAVRRLVDHIELLSADDIRLELRDGRLVRWGSSQSSDQKGEVLLALLKRQAKVYDVSVPGQPTTSDLVR